MNGAERQSQGRKTGESLLSREFGAVFPVPKRGYSTVTVFARLRGSVDVGPAQARDAVREQLERQRREHRLEERRRLRDVDHVVRVVLDVLVAVGRDRDHVGAAGARLLDVRDDLVVDVDVRRHDDDRRALAEQRDRAVLHLAGGVRLGRDVQNILQLQRALERHRQADVAAEEEEERLLVEALRDLVDRVPALVDARTPASSRGSR